MQVVKKARVTLHLDSEFAICPITQSWLDNLYLVQDEYNRAQLNFYIKYGDMGASAKSRSALMKQKHRMIWERRNGENTVAGQAKRAAEEAAAALA